MTNDLLITMFTSLTAIAAIALVAGAIARRLGQPAVVGEIVAGVLLGPTVAHGALASALFPTEVRGLLSGFADLGVALMMFVVGLEFEPGVARGSNRNILGVAAGAVLVPLALGCGLGLVWTPGGPVVSDAGYVLFVGISLSVTAFPVLVRVLEDRRLLQTPVGRLSVTSAAVCDVAIWVLLGLDTLTVAGQTPTRLLLLPVFLAVLAFVVRPLFRRAVRGGAARFGGVDLVMVAVGLLASCAVTQWMGLDFIFGAFLFGMSIAGSEQRAKSDARGESVPGVVDPEGPSGWAARLRREVEPIGAKLLMPIFFIVAGWQVNLAALSPAEWLTALGVVAVAVLGKIGGTYLGARLTGIPSRQATILGVLMNTRGLTELIVLTAGRQMGLVDASHYTVLVVMALLTTIATGPLLTLLVGKVGKPGHPLATEPPAHTDLVGAASGPAAEHRAP